VNDLVVFRSVAAGYRAGEHILNDIDASFAEAHVHAITGPSGCGKSTMLYVAGLMLRPARGRVMIEGRDHSTGTDHQRARARAEQIGFVFQDALLEPSMTVAQNIFEGVPFTRRVAPFRERAAQLCERLGVIDLFNQRASRLSGGQGQRVALVRAMLKDPAVILADEPTGNLDDATAQAVLHELFEFGRRPGHSTIIVTHDTRIAEQSDSTIELRRPC
jgi:ABC-type lipoprotein export system ATPase subunit